MATNQAILNMSMRLGADIRQFESKLSKAQKRTQRFASGMQKVGGVLAGAFAVGGITSYVKETVNAQVETKRWADRLGLASETFQELSFAGKKFGVTQDAMTDGFKELSLRADEFAKTGKGTAVEAFERLGLGRQQINQVKGDTEALFNLIQSKMQNVQDVAARQRIADELFGGQAGEQFTEFLSQSTEDIKGLRKEAKEAGAVLSGDMAEKLEDAQNAFSKLSDVMSTVTSQILANMAPAFSKFAGLLENIATNNEKQAASLFGVSDASKDAAKTQRLFWTRLLGLQEASNKSLKTHKDLLDKTFGGGGGGTERGLLAQQIAKGGGKDTTGGKNKTGLQSPFISDFMRQSIMQGPQGGLGQAQGEGASPFDPGKLGLVDEKMAGIVERTKKLTEETKKVTKQWKSFEQASKVALESTGAVFADMVKGVEGAAQQLVKQLIQIAIRFAIITALKQIATGGVSGALSGVANFLTSNQGAVASFGTSVAGGLMSGGSNGAGSMANRIQSGQRNLRVTGELRGRGDELRAVLDNTDERQNRIFGS